MQVFQRLNGQVGVDGAGAVADEQGEVHDLARLARLDDESHLGAGFLADEVVVHGGERQQAGDERVVLVEAAVGKDEQRVAALDGQRGAAAQTGQRALQFLGAALDAVEGGQGGGEEVAPGDAAQLLQVAVGEEGMRELERVAVLRRLVQDVALGADEAGQRHHQLLADRVDGRVGDLGEHLLEVVEQRLGLVGEAGQRGVDAHRADRLLAVGGHRGEDHLQVLGSVAERALVAEDAVDIGGVPAGRLGQRVDGDLVFLEPIGVRLAAGEAVLDLLVGDDAALLGVHQQHAAGLEAAFEADLLGGEVEHAGLGGDNDAVVVGHQVAGGPQAVAVEGGADEAAVGEGDGGRAVPGLHQRGVVFVKGPFFGRHGGVAGPGLGDEHGHDVGQAAPGQVEQLNRVVEDGRIAAARGDDGEQLADVGAEQGRGKHGLAGVHPGDVAAQGVDLAVVAKVAEGVGELPGGEGVGGEALVDQAQRAGHLGIRQLPVEIGDLGGQQQALVNDGPRGERRDVEEALVGQVRGGDLVFDPLADEVELAFEGVLIEAVGVADEDLLDVGPRGAGDAADGVVVDGRVAPAEHGQAFLAHDALQDAFGEEAFVAFDRQEDHADAVLARRRESEAEAVTLTGEEGVGDLDEDAGAVTGVGVAAGGAAVGQVDEDLDSLEDDLVGLAALDVDDEADAAGVALGARVVETLRGRKPV